VRRFRPSKAVVRALRAAERLREREGVSVEVIDLRSLRPLDLETVAASVAKTNRALCVEEGCASYGVTAEIAARIQSGCIDDLDAPVERVGAVEVPLRTPRTSSAPRWSARTRSPPPRGRCSVSRDEGDRGLAFDQLVPRAPSQIISSTGNVSSMIPYFCV
jgi:hypothetical protein